MAKFSYTPASPKFKDLSGQRFGRLVVLEIHGLYRDKTILWRCVCDCGEEKTNIRSADLTKGKVKSCGCLNREVTSSRNTKHGLSKKPEYRSWKAMKERCYNEHHIGYKLYGGRGITVCGRWLKSFEVFFRDMGPKPSPSHSIDRINNNSGYSPENCHWATPSMQIQNQRRTKLTPLLVRQVRKIYLEGGNLAEWARNKGVTRQAARAAATGRSWKDI